MDDHVLYTMPASLYSAKARSYLRCQRIPFHERVPGDPRYDSRIVPVVGRWILPVLECPDGTLVQDTVDIIDHLDAQVGPDRSAYPATPVHRVVAHVLELFGGEGLLRPAMHYRWNFDEDNLPFLSADFASALAPLGSDDATRAMVFDFASGRMRAATTSFGVTPETVPTIEESYAEFLERFDAHLAVSPYLLGGRPTLGDFAFMGPLHAHLARDPHPSLVMKQRAPRVWRWVERMQSADGDVGEYGDLEDGLFPDDAVPPTLAALLAYIAGEDLDEIADQVRAVDAWLADHPDVAEGEVVGGKPSHRSLGTTTFRWRDHDLTVGVIPYRMVLLQRLRDAHDGLDDAGRAAARAALGTAGLDPLLELRPRRRVERRDNREVWGAEEEPVLLG